MPWSTLSNRPCELHLDTQPPVAVVNLRLIDDFKEHALGIPRRIVLRELPPEVREPLHESVVGESRFEVAFRMDVNHNRKSMVENHLDCGIQRSEVLLLRAPTRKYGCRIHAQAHMVEAERRNQRYVPIGRVRGVVLLVIGRWWHYLGKPLAEVDPAAQMRQARRRNRRRNGHRLRPGGHAQQRRHQTEVSISISHMSQEPSRRKKDGNENLGNGGPIPIAPALTPASFACTSV